MSDIDVVASNSVLRLEWLPLAVLAQILSFHGLTTALIRLYLTGSREMQRKVLRSGSNIHLEAFLRLEFARLPSIFAQLTSLRSLTIKRGGNPLLDDAHTMAVLKAAGPTLEKLELDFARAPRLFDSDAPALLHEALHQLAMTPGNLEVSSLCLDTRFPRLCWLKFGSHYQDCIPFPQAFPPTLTHLECRFSFSEDDPPILFPPLLTHLAAGTSTAFPQEFYDALPSNLDFLSLILYSDYRSTELTLEAANALPRSLRTLQFEPAFSHLEPVVFDALPPGLENLINCKFFIEKGRPFKQLASPRGSAPLRRLDPHQLGDLPRTLEWLSVGLVSTNLLKDLPPSLVRLEVDMKECELSRSNIVVLPSDHLVSLEITAYYISADAINLLPPNLTHLVISITRNIVRAELLRFPLLLKELEFSVRNQDEVALSFAPLPHTLTSATLKLPLRIENLFALPPLLRHLTIDNITDRNEFDRSNPIALERIHHLRDMAQKAGFVFDETLPTRAPRTYAVWDLLPRTLQKFEMRKVYSKLYPPAHWQSLPKNLLHLHIVGPMHPDSLEFVPYDTVTELLSLQAVTWKTKHIKRLHPRLVELRAGSLPITHENAPWIPRNAVWELDLEDHNKGRKDALGKLDREAFHALNERR